MFDDEDARRYRAVINDEGQYSIWPIDRDPPPGWAAAGPSVTKAECLAHISVAWTDLRPRSLRERSGSAR
jgi:MbtH protein